MFTLTPQEVEDYRREGYLLCHKQLFSPEKLDRLQAIFEEHLAAKGDRFADELDTPHFKDERLLEFLLSDEVLDLVEPLTGPDIALWSSHFICKEPYRGRATPWHEDSAYWQGKVNAYDRIVTVWLALDPSKRENGCMRVIPRTHHNGFSDYEDIDRQFYDRYMFHSQVKNVDESQAVYFELDRGECSLHDARLIHGAEANLSPLRRCGYTMRYFPTSVKFYPEKNFKGFKIWLARGNDRAGNPYANA